jgi:hypothetical protein
LHSQYRISVSVEGNPKAFNVPAQLVEQTRPNIDMRRRFDAAADTI